MSYVMLHNMGSIELIHGLDSGYIYMNYMGYI